MTDRFRLVPAVYVVLRRGSHGNEVLLQRRKNTGYMDRLVGRGSRTRRGG
ncbi:MAG TPA: hypothetical protein VIL34_03525 [Actinopolymorphaceae bacterium]